MRRESAMRIFWRAGEGIAAVEFALTISFLVLLVLGGVELARFGLISQKTDKVAATVADIVTQSTSVSIADLNIMLGAAAQVMEPYDFSDNGIVILTSVSQNGAYTPQNPPTINWQYSGGGTLARSSAIGVTGGPATLPGGLVLNDKDNVIVAEVYYHYTPILDSSIVTSFLAPQDLYRVVVYKPRLGALTTPPS